MEVLIADTFTEIRESDKQSESIEIVESIVNETYRYLVGSNTGLPFVRSETLLHYNLNPSDYMWLYQHDKELFILVLIQQHYSRRFSVTSHLCTISTCIF